MLLLYPMDTIISDNITEAANQLMADNVIAIPTETVYGLAANALNIQAVAKIFEIKNRPTFNPLIVHCASWQVANEYVSEIPCILRLLMNAFSPGPITFLLKKKDSIPDLVTAGSPLVAIRVPSHPSTLALLNKLPFPLAAPSANQFGYISPTTAMHVYQSLHGKIPFILNGLSAKVGIESTIVGFDKVADKVVVYRVGAISIAAIEKCIGTTILLQNKPTNNPLTAGQLKSHYAPYAPLYVGNVNELIHTHGTKNIYTISLDNIFENVPIQNQYALSPRGNINEAAQNLFAALRSIDEQKPDCILAEIFPNEGIGMAINDRLQRASASSV